MRLRRAAVGVGGAVILAAVGGYMLTRPSEHTPTATGRYTTVEQFHAILDIGNADGARFWALPSTAPATAYIAAARPLAADLRKMTAAAEAITLPPSIPSAVRTCLIQNLRAEGAAFEQIAAVQTRQEVDHILAMNLQAIVTVAEMDTTLVDQLPHAGIG